MQKNTFFGEVVEIINDCYIIINMFHGYKFTLNNKTMNLKVGDYIRVEEFWVNIIGGYESVQIILPATEQECDDYKAKLQSVNDAVQVISSGVNFFIKLYNFARK